VSVGEADGFAKKTFINRAENIGREDGEFVRAVWVVKVGDDVLKRFVICINLRRNSMIISDL
jgi:hypothetical protein